LISRYLTYLSDKAVLPQGKFGGLHACGPTFSADGATVNTGAFVGTNPTVASGTVKRLASVQTQCCEIHGVDLLVATVRPNSSRRPRRDIVQPDWWSQTSDFARADLRSRKDRAVHPTPTKNRRDLLVLLGREIHGQLLCATASFSRSRRSCSCE